jgi:hypothetical protein
VLDTGVKAAKARRPSLASAWVRGGTGMALTAFTLRGPRPRRMPVTEVIFFVLFAMEIAAVVIVTV